MVSSTSFSIVKLALDSALKETDALGLPTTFIESGVAPLVKLSVAKELNGSFSNELDCNKRSSK